MVLETILQGDPSPGTGYGQKTERGPKWKRKTPGGGESMKNVPLSILLAVLVLSIPPASGEEGPPPTPAPQTQTAPAVPGTPPPVDLQERRPTVSPPSDEEIRAAVEEALARAVSISEHAKLRVGCEEGILTLSGEAETLEVLHEARRLSGDTRGVLDVAVAAGISTRGAPDPP